MTAIPATELHLVRARALPVSFSGRTNYNPHLIDCTAPGNLADATGLAIPFGSFGHLPRGLQLLGPPAARCSCWIWRTSSPRIRDPALGIGLGLRAYSLSWLRGACILRGLADARR